MVSSSNPNAADQAVRPPTPPAAPSPPSDRGCRHVSPGQNDRLPASNAACPRERRSAFQCFRASTRKASIPQSGEPIRVGWLIGTLELPVDPADRIAIGNVANEQEQRVGHLVEPAVAQRSLCGRGRHEGILVAFLGDLEKSAKRGTPLYKVEWWGRLRLDREFESVISNLLSLFVSSL
jgi:hypothetical protein